MKNLKISKKIICTFAVVLLLTFILGVVSLVSTNNIASTSDNYVNISIPALSNLESARRYIRIFQGNILKATCTDNQADLDKLVEDISSDRGAIDAHTHLAMPFGGTISSDDYYAGTRAAACGGTTTVFDFILQDFGETMVDAIKRRDALCAPDAAVDYAFHVAVKDVSNGLIDTIEDAVNYGVSSFKVFMVYDFGVTDGVFYKVLEKAKSCGAMISVHAENKQLIDVLTERYLSEGKTSAWYHYMSRPRNKR